MTAEFILTPTSGQYQEQSFDIDAARKGPDWCWVQFTTAGDHNWVGAFRGTPIKTATAQHLQQVAVLTSDGLYLLDPQQKVLLWATPNTEYVDLIGVPGNDAFVLATYSQIGFLDRDFHLHLIPSDINVENIQFLHYEGDVLHLEWDTVPEYQRENGYLDTKDWKNRVYGDDTDTHL